MFGDNYQPNPYSEDPADRLVGRIMAAEYNLAVQRQGAASASPLGILGQMFGEWLQTRAGRS